VCAQPAHEKRLADELQQERTGDNRDQAPDQDLLSCNSHKTTDNRGLSCVRWV
jgi:hypothetical protein